MNQDHIIQKVFVEITVNNKEKAYGIKEDISSFLSIDVFPEIEKHIEALEHKFSGQTLQIPKLELNLEIKNSSLNAELKDTIVRHFKEELAGVTGPLLSSEQETENSVEAYLVGNQEKMIQTFLYFLEHGSMPWWNPGKKGIRFLEPAVFEILIAADSFPKYILPVLGKQHIQDRMIHQLSDLQLVQLCREIVKNRKLEISLKDDMIISISKFTFPDRMIIWRLILDVLSEYAANVSQSSLREYVLEQTVKTGTFPELQERNSPRFKAAIPKIFPFIKKEDIENGINRSLESQQPDFPEHAKSFLETIHQKNPIANEEAIPDEGQYIQHAGLILIHPFIKTFFQHCGLLDSKNQQLLDPELGAHLLHYIATGKTNAPEYDMVFEKFLCNIPLHQTINRHVKLSRKHKTEAKTVIESICHNWSPMKNSSIELLQNEFFQRPGKLAVTDYDYTLTVERKTQDILLDKLAWGIGLVKLPWKEKFMYVNW